MKPIERRNHPARLPSWIAVALALVFLTETSRTSAAPPKEGRYRGKITLSVVVEGTKAEVKKVFPAAGVLSAGKLQLVIPELPEISNYFTSPTFNCNVEDGAITMLPNDNALPLMLGDVRTTATLIRGSVDLGQVSAPSGTGTARRFISLSLSRVGK